MITYCANMNMGVYATITGSGIPKGKVQLWAEGHPRNNEIMSPEEAKAIGIAEGYLIEFRATDSFYLLCRHYLRFYPDSFDELCKREEMDPEEVKKVLNR